MRKVNKKVRKHHNNNCNSRKRTCITSSRIQQDSAKNVFLQSFAKSLGENLGTGLGKWLSRGLGATIISAIVSVQNGWNSLNTIATSVLEIIKLLISNFLYTYYTMKGRIE